LADQAARLAQVRVGPAGPVAQAVAQAVAVAQAARQARSPQRALSFTYMIQQQPVGTLAHRGLAATSIKIT